MVKKIKVNIASRFAHLKDMETKMLASLDGAINQLSEIYRGLRAGRPSASLLNGVSVEAYGSMEKLSNLANVTVAEGRMLLVKVYDESIAKAVENGIIEANMGLNPLREGAAIRVPVPELNMEQRKILVKKVNEYAENIRKSIRDIRRNALDVAKVMKKSGELSEDDLKIVEKEVQAIINHYIDEVDDAAKKKNAEILD